MSDNSASFQITDDKYPIYMIRTEDVQEAANNLLGRKLSEIELYIIKSELRLDCCKSIETSIRWRLR